MAVMKPYQTIIIDDEEPSRLRLRNLAVHFSDSLEIVGEAENGEQAIELIDNQWQFRSFCHEDTRARRKIKETLRFVFNEPAD